METAREELKLVRATREKEELLLKREKEKHRIMSDIERRLSKVEQGQEKILEGSIILLNIQSAM